MDTIRLVGITLLVISSVIPALSTTARRWIESLTTGATHIIVVCTLLAGGALIAGSTLSIGALTGIMASLLAK